VGERKGGDREKLGGQMLGSDLCSLNKSKNGGATRKKNGVGGPRPRTDKNKKDNQTKFVDGGETREARR